MKKTAWLDVIVYHGSIWSSSCAPECHHHSPLPPHIALLTNTQSQPLCVSWVTGCTIMRSLMKCCWITVTGKVWHFIASHLFLKPPRPLTNPVMYWQARPFFWFGWWGRQCCYAVSVFVLLKSVWRLTRDMQKGKGNSQSFLARIEIYIPLKATRWIFQPIVVKWRHCIGACRQISTRTCHREKTNWV